MKWSLSAASWISAGRSFDMRLSDIILSRKTLEALKGMEYVLWLALLGTPLEVLVDDILFSVDYNEELGGS